MRLYQVIEPTTSRKMSVQEARRLNAVHMDAYGSKRLPGYVGLRDELDVPPSGYEWRYIAYGWGLHLQKSDTNIYGGKISR